ncbi:hypothetical protein LTR16_005530, partial [Cryomyces antarcticus]
KNLTSAIDRYGNEIKRVLHVIDRHLKRNGTPYLVGDRCTYADLAFLTWDMALGFLMQGEAEKLGEEYPEWKRWNARLMDRPAVKKIVEDRGKATAATKP